MQPEETLDLGQDKAIQWLTELALTSSPKQMCASLSKSVSCWELEIGHVGVFTAQNGADATN